MIKPNHYVCIYCDLSGDNEEIIYRHILESHNVKQVKETDSKRTVWLG